jgi:hypothetical protein
MNTVREAMVRVMPPATETAWRRMQHPGKEVAA